MRRFQGSSAVVAATFAVGAGALGCGGPQTPPAGYGGPETGRFIVQHRPELEREIAIGSGSTLYDLSIVAGCEDLDALERELHRHRAELFAGNGSAADDATVADRIVSMMTEHREMRCVDLDLSRQRVFAAGRHKVGGVSEPGSPARWR